MPEMEAIFFFPDLSFVHLGIQQRERKKQLPVHTLGRERRDGTQ